MTKPDPDRQHEVALFSYGIIADLVRIPPGTKGLHKRIEEKAVLEYKIPGTIRTRIGPETIRDWIKNYSKGSFEALLPKPRADSGQSRTIPREVVELILYVKEENPKLSVQLVIREVRASGKVSVTWRNL